MRLSELFLEFEGLDARERLEMLVEFSDSLPGLSAERAAVPPPDECRVRECQTPVDLWIDVVDGRVHLEAIVPRQSPTIRGLVALMIEGLEGSPADEVIAMPADVLAPLGLGEALGMQRLHGTQGLIAAIKRRTLAANVS